MPIELPGEMGVFGQKPKVSIGRNSRKASIRMSST
jgi:hypothetical protein